MEKQSGLIWEMKVVAEKLLANFRWVEVGF